MVALLLLVLKHDDEAASSDPHIPSSALPAKYALESLSLSLSLLCTTIESFSLLCVFRGKKRIMSRSRHYGTTIIHHPPEKFLGAHSHTHTPSSPYIGPWRTQCASSRRMYEKCVCMNALEVDLRTDDDLTPSLKMTAIL